MGYFVHGADGRTYGPSEWETLRVWATEGRLLPGTMLAEEDTGRLLRADQVLAPEDFPPAPLSPPPSERACPHCGHLTAGDRQLCPHCGFSLPSESLGLLPQWTLTGVSWGDIALGLLLSLLFLAAPTLWVCITTIPTWEQVLSAALSPYTFLFLAAVIMAFFLLRRRTAAFASGVGAGAFSGCIAVPILAVFAIVYGIATGLQTMMLKPCSQGGCASNILLLLVIIISLIVLAAFIL